jgi:hypothetical protein
LVNPSSSASDRLPLGGSCVDIGREQFRGGTVVPPLTGLIVDQKMRAHSECRGRQGIEGNREGAHQLFLTEN